MFARVSIATALVTLAAAAPAVAADRYASPTGTAADACTAGDPCDVQTAVAGGSDADTVHLAGGEYVLSGVLVVDKHDMTVMGPESGARARLIRNGGTAVIVNADGVTVRRLDIRSDAAAGGVGALQVQPGSTDALLEHLRIAATGVTSFGAIVGGGSLLGDSSVTTETTSSSGVMINTGGARLVNLTVNAPGAGSSGVNLDHNFTAAGTHEGFVANTIVHGAAADLRVNGTGTDTLRLHVAYSNFDSFFMGATNSELVLGDGNQQTEAPVLRSDGVTQEPESPTVDAGDETADIGAVDLFGGERISGATVDIGAHELQVSDPPVVVPPTPTPPTPPTPVTGAVSQPTIDETSPVLSGARFNRRRFAVGPEPTALAAQRTARGTTLSWTLSEAATVNVGIERSLAGLRVRASGRLRCRRATPATRRTLRRQLLRTQQVRRTTGRRRAALLRRLTRARRCTVIRNEGTIRRRAAAGPGSLAFSGRMGSRPLAAGRYVAVVDATDAAGNGSAARSLPFRIVRR